VPRCGFPNSIFNERKEGTLGGGSDEPEASCYPESKCLNNNGNEPKEQCRYIWSFLGNFNIRRVTK
jgi:hypothetical protein